MQYKKIYKSLIGLNYPIDQLKEQDLLEYEAITLIGETKLDIFNTYLDTVYEDVEIQNHNYNGVSIKIASKKSLIKILEQFPNEHMDLRVLKGLK